MNNSVKYEMGVLVYNLMVNYTENPNVKSKENYDIKGNFDHLLENLSLKTDELKDGFISESQNHGMETDKANVLFHVFEKLVNSTEE